MNSYKAVFCKILCSFILLVFCFSSNAQNCGNVTDFVADIVNNNDGTHTYTFHVTIQATSGGSKSVKLTISCQNNTFVNSICEASEATTRVVDYGPFTVPSCTDHIELIWSGHSNAACGGTTCNPPASLPLLPVELSSIQATKQGEYVLLDWSTASEINNDKFIIERSVDARAFISIGEMAGNGTSTEQQHYQFKDRNPLPGINYYRLRQVDFDGTIDYSKTIQIKTDHSSHVAFYPTEVLSKGTLVYHTEQEGAVAISVFDVIGRPVLSQSMFAGEGQNSFEIDMGKLRPGSYFMVFDGVHQPSTTLRFVKER